MTALQGSGPFRETRDTLIPAVPNGLMVSACPHTEPYQTWSDLLVPPFRIVDGEIPLNDRRGFGLTLNEDFIVAHRA